MACFIFPMVLAMLVTAVTRRAREAAERLRLSLLSAMLWGGSAILAMEHIWSGEVTLRPPFFTAMKSLSDINVLLREVLTVGPAISAATIGLWGAILAFESYLFKAHALRALKQAEGATFKA